MGMMKSLKLAAVVGATSLAALGVTPGLAGGADRPVTGDWDGNNTTTIGVVRPDPESNNWIWLQRNSNSEGSPDTSFSYGNKLTDTVVTGDWNGNNATTIGIARPDPESNNWIWRLSNSNAGGSVDIEFLYGNKLTDTVVTGDWDGNNTTTIGVARPDPESYNWIWLLSNSNAGGSVDIEFLYGNKYEDVPVVGDWDGNNTTTIGIVHPDPGSNNLIWRLSNKNAGGSVDIEFPYGNKLTDTVVTGDWDGNNTTTIGVARPETSNWRWLLRNSNSEGTSSLDFLFGSTK
jgi:hypothetical protein